MANRSDFFSSKFPRGMKRMMAMGETYGYIKSASERNKYKKSMIEAHANHVGYKMRRNTVENKDVEE